MVTQSQPAPRLDQKVFFHPETEENPCFYTVRWELFEGVVHLSNVRQNPKPPANTE